MEVPMADSWIPRPELTADEVAVLALCKKQKLWSFFRLHQHLILDDEIRSALRAMYPVDGPGRPPVAPEVLAIALLLQVGFGVADHEVPTLTAVDARWQMVLGCGAHAAPAFSQGTVFNFRERARKHGLMGRLLNKTVTIARETGGFDHKRMRAMIDSSPLLGAGRVEDTFNLLGRALRELIEEAAAQAGRQPVDLARELEVSVAFGTSVKAALDIDWRDPSARAQALRQLMDQFEVIRVWLGQRFHAELLQTPPLSERIATVERIIKQDTEPKPPDGGSGAGDEVTDIRDGVAADRLISLSDRDMRHGRKSKSKSFTGYKRHVGVDADIPGLIAAVTVLPANRPEHEAAQPILSRLGERFDIVQLQIDRGYLAAPAVIDLHERGVEVITKSPLRRRGERFTKPDFEVDFDGMTGRCPAGVVTAVRNNRLTFKKADCHACALKTRCITDKNKAGRNVPLHPQERWYRRIDEELGTSEGRAKRRERAAVEHDLARAGALQGNKARYRGLAKNQAHFELVAAVNNCYVIGRQLRHTLMAA
jgi:hypothetical protein